MLTESKDLKTFSQHAPCVHVLFTRNFIIAAVTTCDVQKCRCVSGLMCVCTLGIDFGVFVFNEIMDRRYAEKCISSI